jgi:hypothetical protein
LAGCGAATSIVEAAGSSTPWADGWLSFAASGTAGVEDADVIGSGEEEVVVLAVSASTGDAGGAAGPTGSAIG